MESEHIQYVRIQRAGYWARWMRRWKWSALTVAGLMALAMVTSMGLDNPFGAIGVLMAFPCFGIPLGTLVNFVVAAFPPYER